MLSLWRISLNSLRSEVAHAISSGGARQPRASAAGSMCPAGAARGIASEGGSVREGEKALEKRKGVRERRREGEEGEGKVDQDG